MQNFVILGVEDPWVPTYFASMWVSPSLEVEVGTGQAWREIPSLPSFGSFPSGPNYGGQRRPNSPYPLEFASRASQARTGALLPEP